MIKEFTSYLASGLTLTVGTTIHAGEIPSGKPDLCTVVKEPVGAYNEPGLPNHREWHFQITTRGPSLFTARTEAHRIFDWIIGQRGLVLTSWFIVSVSGSAPGYSGRDPSSRYLYTANLSLPARKRT